jgi:hypothetical protein
MTSKSQIKRRYFINESVEISAVFPFANNSWHSCYSEIIVDDGYVGCIEDKKAYYLAQYERVKLLNVIFICVGSVCLMISFVLYRFKHKGYNVI